MKKLALALLLLFFTPALAVVYPDYYVAAVGSDANDCLTPATACRQIQRAVDLAPMGITSNIHVTAGDYLPVHISHYKDIGLFGDCSDFDFPTRILIPTNGIGFDVQDLSILQAMCWTMVAQGGGAIGVSSRQFSIVDNTFTRFTGFASGYHVSAQEKARITSVNSYVASGGTAHAIASGQSLVTLGGALVILSSVTFGNFLVAVDAQIDMTGVAITDNGASGGQYALDQGTLNKGGVTVPGSGSSAINNSVVR